MNNNLVFIPNVTKINNGYFKLFIILFVILVLYNLFRIISNSNFEINYLIFVVLIINMLWTLFVNKKVRKLTFNNDEQKLQIVQKAVFGKNEIYSISYSELNFEIENNNRFWNMINGKKEVTFLKNKMELFKLDNSSGFDENNLIEIEKKLKEIENACR